VDSGNRRARSRQYFSNLDAGRYRRLLKNDVSKNGRDEILGAAPSGRGKMLLGSN
jgi:hypothetical protein